MKSCYKNLLCISTGIIFGSACTCGSPDEQELVLDEHNVDAIKKISSETEDILLRLANKQKELQQGLKKMRAKLADKKVGRAHKAHIGLLQASFSKTDQSMTSLQNRLKTSSVISPRLKQYAQWLMGEAEKSLREFAVVLARAEGRSHSVKRYVPAS